mmetsp:Transcript_4016/g.4580  ORF Transcript_4016/g.4580 Transcript_4016/m.4580 type:complete len:216 (-) Transcript_4016:1798-2445(-)
MLCLALIILNRHLDSALRGDTLLLLHGECRIVYYKVKVSLLGENILEGDDTLAALDHYRSLWLGWDASPHHRTHILPSLLTLHHQLVLETVAYLSRLKRDLNLHLYPLSASWMPHHRRLRLKSALPLVHKLARILSFRIQVMHEPERLHLHTSKRNIKRHNPLGPGRSPRQLQIVLIFSQVIRFQRQLLHELLRQHGSEGNFYRRLRLRLEGNFI